MPDEKVYGVLLVLKRGSDEVGSRVPLVKPVLTVGRDDGNDVRILLPHVSKKQCVISVSHEDGKAFLANVSRSVNSQTLVQNRLVEWGEKTRLYQNDVITVGDRRLTWCYPKSSALASQYRSFGQDTCEAARLANNNKDQPTIQGTSLDDTATFEKNEHMVVSPEVRKDRCRLHQPPKDHISAVFHDLNVSEKKTADKENGFYIAGNAETENQIEAAGEEDMKDTSVNSADSADLSADSHEMEQGQEDDVLDESNATAESDKIVSPETELLEKTGNTSDGSPTKAQSPKIATDTLPNEPVDIDTNQNGDPMIESESDTSGSHLMIEPDSNTSGLDPMIEPNSNTSGSDAEALVSPPSETKDCQSPNISFKNFHDRSHAEEANEDQCDMEMTEADAAETPFNHEDSSSKYEDVKMSNEEISNLSSEKVDDSNMDEISNSSNNVLDSSAETGMHHHQKDDKGDVSKDLVKSDEEDKLTSINDECVPNSEQGKAAEIGSCVTDTNSSFNHTEEVDAEAHHSSAEKMEPQCDGHKLPEDPGETFSLRLDEELAENEANEIDEKSNCQDPETQKTTEAMDAKNDDAVTSDDPSNQKSMEMVDKVVHAQLESSSDEDHNTSDHQEALHGPPSHHEKKNVKELDEVLDTPSRSLRPRRKQPASAAIEVDGPATPLTTPGRSLRPRRRQESNAKDSETGLATPTRQLRTRAAPKRLSPEDNTAPVSKPKGRSSKQKDSKGSEEKNPSPLKRVLRSRK